MGPLAVLRHLGEDLDVEIDLASLGKIEKPDQDVGELFAEALPVVLPAGSRRDLGDDPVRSLAALPRLRIDVIGEAFLEDPLGASLRLRAPVTRNAAQPGAPPDDDRHPAERTARRKRRLPIAEDRLGVRTHSDVSGITPTGHAPRSLPGHGRPSSGST